MIRRIFVFANMGFLDQLPKSGGQSSARRVMEGLKEEGFEVIPIRRHRAELEGRWKHQMEIMTFAVIDLFRIMGKMMMAKRKEAAFLHLTYAGTLVPYELLLTIAVRLLGYKSLIYLKGGQVLEGYANGSELHRWMFKKTMDMQEKVFFEGVESMKLVEEITETSLVYFPNFVFDRQIPQVLSQKPKDKINILYFGRIAPDKNVHIGIETFNLLCEKYDNIHYTIVGGIGPSKAYGENIDKLIADSPYQNRIERIGISSQEFLIDLMQTQHFFLFPTQAKAEGHSNSLNESMSQGVIPIVSDFHFNRSVVGNDMLVVQGYNPKDYADRIDHIITNYNMDLLSKQMWQRVKVNYAYSVVNENVCKELRNIDV